MLGQQVVVIVGAGGSFDCALSRPAPLRSPDMLWRPPLTLDLFEPRLRFGTILDAYPGARAAAAEIRVRLARNSESEDAFALEKYLRDELKESSNPDARYRFRQIPLYLQHLLFEVSRSYTTDPENYSRLVNGALGSGLENVVFMTLNYDTILDRELFHRTREGAVSGNPKTRDDYISEGRSWALIKLHGSVNWGRRVFAGGLPETEPGPHLTGWFEGLAEAIDKGDIDREIELRVEDNVTAMRRDGNDLYYPALSVPIGPDPDLLNCPKPHLSALRQRLKRMGGEMNVLVVGYSGLDDEVMDLLAEGGKIRRLAIVDIDPQSVHARFERKFGALETEHFAGGFAAWSQSGDLDAYFQRLTTSP